MAGEEQTDTSAASHGAPRSAVPATLLALGAVAAIYYALTVIAMHAIQPEVDPVHSTGVPSLYALGRWGWWVGLANVLFGLGILAFAVGAPYEPAEGLAGHGVGGAAGD